MNRRQGSSIERKTETTEACTTRSRCCNLPTYPGASCLLYITLKVDYIASKALGKSWSCFHTVVHGASLFVFSRLNTGSYYNAMPYPRKHICSLAPLLPSHSL